MDNGKFTATISDLVTEKKFATAVGMLRNCEVHVDIETNERDFTDEKGQAMSKLTFTVNLAQSEHPWQPHMDQAWEMAGVLSEAVVEELECFLENID